MRSTCLYLVIFFLFAAQMPLSLHAQVNPAEDSKLNYRIIGFSFPAKQGASQYVIEIATGRWAEDKDFAGNMLRKITSDKNKVIIELPSWGTEYTWRVIYKSGNTVVASSEYYHLATNVLPESGTNAKRLRITSKQPSKSRSYTDQYVLVDGVNTTMYDMAGNPVWFLPDDDSVDANTDVKVSWAGTVTFLARKDAYEVGYDGKVQWRAKSENTPADSIPIDFDCHHELNRLGNGNYMVLTTSEQGLPVPVREAGGVKFFPPMFSSTLMELDATGNIVWSWESAKYIRESDLGVLQSRFPGAHLDLHENAFYFDEKNKVVYLCMSGVSRIVKIKYPSGEVLNEYGGKFATGAGAPVANPRGQTPVNAKDLITNKLFSHPHSLHRSEDGFLYLFDNNKPRANAGNGNRSYPQVLKLKESGDSLSIVWKYDCRSIVGNRTDEPGGGGNVVVLGDNSMFVSMCNPYGDIFIVDGNKNILWSAIAEAYQPYNQTWTQYPVYKASILNRAQLEQLVWGKP